MKKVSPTLQAQQLSIGYRNKKADKIVRAGLDLEVYQGELLCLMGPNGAGKSTLLRTLAGVQEPLAGQVIMEGQPIHQLAQQERARRISLVLTEQLSAGNMNVLELVALGRYPHTGWGGSLSPADKEMVLQALNDLDIGELAGRKLYELSDGQRQKAMIARALAQDGQLMILDEPTAHLDLINRLQIMRQLRLLALRRQKAILVATHELELALQSADRLWLLPQEQEGFLAGMPEDLVLNGSLAKAFNRSGFHFDLSSGRFVEEVEHCVPVYLEGEGPARHWTEKALQRYGYALSHDKSTPLSIRITAEHESYHWQLFAPEGEKVADSLEALVKSLMTER
ncbi:ABC transporter ATP-binding protein [Nafulsella turpanensis]|uniref:ABC transporter ATP-binding protein n=1 Tax=Nafulsella turpanensis TaxID=1265690 RepID=UPI000349F358|nr:ABC transporter ATP-binding protein [Nafulsella turpanensis]